MKKLLIAALALASLVACKKEKTVVNTPQFSKKITSSVYDNGVQTAMQYNAQGRIISLTGNLSSTTYQYSPAFSMKYSQSNLNAEFKNCVTNASGKVIKAEKWLNGNYSSKIEFTYNAKGYLISTKEIRPDYIYVSNFEYQQGNLSGIKMFMDGVLNYSYSFEYYTEIPNPLKLDLLETRSIGFVVDHSFGTLDANLLKRWKGYNEQNQLIKDHLYSYTLDAQGYPVKSVLKTLNGTIITGLYQFQ